MTGLLMENTWLFVLGYVGLVAGFLAVLYLLIRSLVARKSRRRSFHSELDRHTSEEVQLDVRLQNLENRLEQLIAVNTQLNERLKWIEGQMGAVLSGGSVPNRQATTEEQVAQGFKQGKTVSELAEQFGRGKGEIELMLNLRKIRERGTEN